MAKFREERAAAGIVTEYIDPIERARLSPLSATALQKTVRNTHSGLAAAWITGRLITKKKDSRAFWCANPFETEGKPMTHEHFEPLFIPHDSVCIPVQLYQQMRKKIDKFEKIKMTTHNGLKWILQFGEVNDLGKHAIEL